jgi:hypothetical protein
MMLSLRLEYQVWDQLDLDEDFGVCECDEGRASEVVRSGLMFENEVVGFGNTRSTRTVDNNIDMSVPESV